MDSIVVNIQRKASRYILTGSSFTPTTEIFQWKMITDIVLKTIAFVHSNNSYIVVIMYDRKIFYENGTKSLQTCWV